MIPIVALIKPTEQEQGQQYFQRYVKELLRWDEYTRCKGAIFSKSSSTSNPGLVLDGNDRDKACLESLRHVLARIKNEFKSDTGQRLALEATNIQPQPTYKLTHAKFEAPGEDA